MASWRSSSAGERAGVPVEMRFVDMFMAAIGALLFMAMLFVFIIARTRNASPTRVEDLPAGEAPLEILTKTLPPARAKESYAVAIAVRGGSGAVSWKIEGAPPPGMKFDPASGMLSGIPTSPAVGRFIVSAIDRRGVSTKTGPRSAAQPLELTVEPAKTRSRDVEKWLAGFMLALLIVCWVFLRIIVGTLRQNLAALEHAWSNGETELYRSGGSGKTERVELPLGIATEKSALQTAEKLSRGLGFGVLAFAAWFVYNTWFSR